MKFKYDKLNEKLIVQEATKLEYSQLQLSLNRHVKGYRFNPRFKMGLWDGKIDFFHSGNISLGLWKECAKALQIVGSNFELENKEDFPIDKTVTYEDVYSFCKEFFKNHKFKNKKGELEVFFPYDYQIETCFKIIKNRYLLTQVATSGGKSLIMSIVMFYILSKVPDAKFLIVVPSISLVTQFYDNIKNYFYGDIENCVDYYIEIEMEDGNLLKFNPNESILTLNRGYIKAKDLNENDEL